MNTNTYKQDYYFSRQRLNKFILASNGNRDMAMKLYQSNLKLSESLYSTLSIFEIAYRNAIDKQLSNYFNDSDWIINQQIGYMNNNRLSSTIRSKNKVHKFKVKTTIDTFNQMGMTYTHGMVLAKQTLGFWTQYFEPKHYNVVGGHSALMPIFSNLPSGISRSNIYDKLMKIKNLRNRIAHHEPICFSNNNSSVTSIDLTNVITTHNILHEVIDWLDKDLSVWAKKLDNTKFYIELFKLCSNNLHPLSYNIRLNYIKIKHRNQWYFSN